MEEANLANGNFLYSMLFYTIINSKYTAVYLIKECNTLLDSKKEYNIAACSMASSLPSSDLFLIFL